MIHLHENRIDPGMDPCNRLNPESFPPIWRMLLSWALLLHSFLAVGTPMARSTILSPWSVLAKELYPFVKALPLVATISRHEKQMTGTADDCMALLR